MKTRNAMKIREPRRMYPRGILEPTPMTTSSGNTTAKPRKLSMRNEATMSTDVAAILTRASMR
jgi:hypothetical protein